MNGYEAMATILKAEGVEVLVAFPHQDNELGDAYAVVAEGSGAHAQKVITSDQLAPAIKWAPAANQQGKPALIEVTTKADCGEGTLAPPRK